MKEEKKVIVFCHVCARPVKLTKDGRYRRHGYKMTFASKDYYGVPLYSGYRGKEIKRQCRASGLSLKNIN